MYDFVWLILLFISSILWLCNYMDPKSLHFLCFKCTFCHLWHQDAARGMEDETRWRPRRIRRSAVRSAPQRWWSKSPQHRFESLHVQCRTQAFCSIFHLFVWCYHTSSCSSKCSYLISPPGPLSALTFTLEYLLWLVMITFCFSTSYPSSCMIFLFLCFLIFFQ